jgi:quercetin dioxygenase-like cupin family protein
MNEIHQTKTSFVFQEGKVKGFSGADLLSLKNGSIKLVQINPKSDYPIHIHPDKTEFLYVLKGVVTCQVDADNYIVNEGDFITFPAKSKHKIENCSTDSATVLVGGIKEE